MERREACGVCLFRSIIHGDWRAREAGRGGLVKRSVVILLLMKPSGGLKEREGRGMGKVTRKEQGGMGRRIRRKRREADARIFIQTE